MDQHGDRERPEGYEEMMTKLAVQVRELSTDALEIANLSSDEIERIEQIPETERTPEEQNQRVSMQLFYQDGFGSRRNGYIHGVFLEESIRFPLCKIG